MKIGFIGLGIMGSRMATHLLKNDIDITVYNRSAKAVEEMRQKGVKTTYSAKEAIREADIIFSMLSTPEAIEEVFLADKNNEGALAAIKENAIWVDCSTVDPFFSLKMKKKSEERNIRFIDAPVAGSKPQAENAELVFFAGGHADDVKAVEPYFHMMGKRVIHAGDHGKGSALKMVVNIMLAQSMLVFSEGVLFGQSLGIDKDFLLDFLPNLPVSAPFTKFKSEKIKHDNDETEFPLQWMLKDLHLATTSAYKVNQPLFLANLSKSLFADANKSGFGREDFSAIYRFLANRNNSI